MYSINSKINKWFRHFDIPYKSYFGVDIDNTPFFIIRNKYNLEDNYKYPIIDLDLKYFLYNIIINFHIPDNQSYNLYLLHLERDKKINILLDDK